MSAILEFFKDNSLIKLLTVLISMVFSTMDGGQAEDNSKIQHEQHVNKIVHVTQSENSIYTKEIESSEDTLFTNLLY